MKKLFLILATLLIAATVSADPRTFGKVGPASGTGAITVSAAGADKRNCITDLTAGTTSQVRLRVLNGGTTFYEVLIGSNTTVPEHWNDMSPLCGDLNTALTIKATLNSGTVTDTATTISYSGIIVNR